MVSGKQQMEGNSEKLLSRNRFCRRSAWPTVCRERIPAGGMIFPYLNLPFYASEPENGGEGDPGTNSEDGSAELMQSFCEVTFLLDDPALYLDTHPGTRASSPFTGKTVGPAEKSLRKPPA